MVISIFQLEKWYMHIVKVKQYDRAFVVKSKSSSHPYHHRWFLSPEATAITNVWHILLEMFYACTNTLLFRMLYVYLHICTHICIYPSKQNSMHHVINPVLLLCFPLLIVIIVFHCKQGISFIQLVLLMAHLI